MPWARWRRLLKTRGRVFEGGNRVNKKISKVILPPTEIKDLTTSAENAAQASSLWGPFKTWYAGLMGRGLLPDLVQVTVARKIAAVTLAVWKAEESFDAGEMMRQVA